MASKNTPANLLDEAFAPEMFGKDSTTWTAYAQALLDDINVRVQRRVGTTNYASSDALVVNSIKMAERYLACSVLCSRRINFLEASLAQSRQAEGITALIAEVRKNQRNYEAMAEEEFASIASTVPQQREVVSSPASGIVSSSHFPADSTI